MKKQNLATMLETAVAQATTKSIVGSPFNGDWSIDEQYLDARTQLFTEDGIQILYPRMGFINRNTVHEKVQGFKRSTLQLQGLIAANPDKAEAYNEDLKKLAYLANEYTQTIKPVQSKFNNAQLYYKPAFMILPDDTRIECQTCIIIEPLTKGINVSFKIESLKTINAMPQAPTLDKDANNIYLQMLNASR